MRSTEALRSHSEHRISFARCCLAVSAAGDDDELDDQKAAAVETAIAAPDTVADFDLGAYHARLARDNAPTVRGGRHV